MLNNQRGKPFPILKHVHTIYHILALLCMRMCTHLIRIRWWGGCSTDTERTGNNSIDVGNTLRSSTAVPQAQPRVPVLQQGVYEVYGHGKDFGTHPVGFMIGILGGGGRRGVVTSRLR